MTPRPLTLLGLAALTVLVAVSCNVGGLFDAEGSACSADRNCPNNQVCCGGRCTRDCNETGTLVVATTLATDYVPGYEFDVLSIMLDSDERALPVTPVTDLLNPRNVAQFAEVRSGGHSMAVRLLLEGSTVALRETTFEVKADTSLEFVVARGCSGNDCESACETDAECTASDACTVAVCISGQCLQRRQDTLCAVDQRCIPGTGCVVQKDECDIEPQCDDLASCTQERCVDHRCTSTRDDTRCGNTVCDPTTKTADPATGCSPAPCSTDNCLPGPCETASCLGNQCVRTTVCQDREQCCDGVCALNCDNPRACADRPEGFVCRVAVGPCDVAETCDGASDACPPDQVAPSSLVCRARSGDCDVVERCDGVSPQCPPNGLEPEGKVCRARAGDCDAVERCTGVSAACPADVFNSSQSVCRPSAGPCDTPESCTGTNPVCPGDGFLSSATTCRSSAGVCDTPESCTGSSAACPVDRFVSATTVCRSSGGVCDPAENCTGNAAACPADAKSRAACRGAIAECDVTEVCDGVNNGCPPDGFASGNVCRPSTGICDATEVCNGGSPYCPGDGAANVGAVCNGAPNACFGNAVCNGSTVCPPNPVNPGALCSADACNNYYCDGGGGCTDRRPVPEGTCCGTCAACTGGTCATDCNYLGGYPSGWYCAGDASGPPVCGCYFSPPF